MRSVFFRYHGNAVYLIRFHGNEMTAKPRHFLHSKVAVLLFFFDKKYVHRKIVRINVLKKVYNTSSDL